MRSPVIESWAFQQSEEEAKRRLTRETTRARDGKEKQGVKVEMGLEEPVMHSRLRPASSLCKLTNHLRSPGLNFPIYEKITLNYFISMILCIYLICLGTRGS